MLGINETKLGEGFPDHLVSIDGFEIVRKDHDKLGGGVALYICDSVNFKVIDSLPANSLELLCIEILPKASRSFCAVSFYQPPSSKVKKFSELQDVLPYLESSGREIILLSDTNCDILETADPSGTFSSQSRHMTNCCRRQPAFVALNDFADICWYFCEIAVSFVRHSEPITSTIFFRKSSYCLEKTTY